MNKCIYEVDDIKRGREFERLIRLLRSGRSRLHLSFNGRNQLIISFSPCPLHLHTPHFWNSFLYCLQKSKFCHLSNEKRVVFVPIGIMTIEFWSLEIKIEYEATSKCSSRTPYLRWVAPSLFMVVSFAAAMPPFRSWTADSQVYKIQNKLYC